MWVRNQDKTKLVNCDFIEVGGNNVIYAIITGAAINLGTYSTKEKALKVLDTIYEVITLGICDTFQMPQDSEV